MNGAHDANRLRELLDVFIDKFVLCGACKNPETDLKISKTDGMIRRNCKACGAVTDVDMRHKLTTYITNNPPPKPKKGVKGAGKSAGQHVGDAEGDGDGDKDGESDDELTQKIASEAATIPTAEQRGTLDEDWSVDTSEAAVKARVKALEGGLTSALVISGGGGDDDDEGGEDENSPYHQYGVWLVEHRKGGPSALNDGEGPTAAEVFKKAQELGIDAKHRTLQVLMQSLFTSDAVNEMKRYQAVLAKMASASEKHQKSLLGGLERLAGIEQPSLIPNGVPKILMALYQIDALDEELVKHWGTHVSKKFVDKDISKKVKRAAGPFLEWLDQADSDEEDDDDEEEGEEEEEDDDEDLDDL